MVSGTNLGTNLYSFGAGQVARCNNCRWSQRLLGWNPCFCADAKFGRNVGRPAARPTYQLDKLAGSDWRRIDLGEELWAILEPEFAQNL